MKLASVLAFVAVVLGYLLALVAFTARPVSAQVECAMRDAVLRQLAQGSHQGVTGRGLTDLGQMIEIVTGPRGSWTIIVTSPKGVTCIAATGTGWESVKDVLGVPG